MFQWIESELLDLVSGSDMPAVGTVGYPRVTKGTAQALLARMYLKIKKRRKRHYERISESIENSAGREEL